MGVPLLFPDPFDSCFLLLVNSPGNRTRDVVGQARMTADREERQAWKFNRTRTQKNPLLSA
jgi:hypothetical protein